MDNFFTLFEMIGALSRRRYQAAEQNFATLGLNHTEARLLMLLSEAQGEATQDDLSNSLFIDRCNAGRALKRLEQADYIIRRKDDADRRTNLVQMTAKGSKAVGEIMLLRNKIVQSFFRDLSEEDAGRVISLLQKALPDDSMKIPSQLPGKMEKASCLG